MGQKVSDKVTISASADTVLAVITELEDYPEWADGVKQVVVQSRDDEGRPAQAAFDVDAKVADVSYTLDYTYAPDTVSWKLAEGDVISQLDGSYVLSSEGDQTVVVYSLEVDISIPMPGFMKKRAAKQILDTGLKGLKVRAESR